MEDFVEIRQEVQDFHREVRGKYQAIDFMDPLEIAATIKSFKATDLDIILVEGQEDPDAGNKNFGS
jgi:hypothetical protein